MNSKLQTFSLFQSIISLNQSLIVNQLFKAPAYLQLKGEEIPIPSFYSDGFP